MLTLSRNFAKAEATRPNLRKYGPKAEVKRLTLWKHGPMAGVARLILWKYGLRGDPSRNLADTGATRPTLRKYGLKEGVAHLL